MQRERIGSLIQELQTRYLSVVLVDVTCARVALILRDRKHQQLCMRNHGKPWETVVNYVTDYMRQLYCYVLMLLFLEANTCKAAFVTVII